jgi:hypothetical protein
VRPSRIYYHSTWGGKQEATFNPTPHAILKQDLEELLNKAQHSMQILVDLLDVPQHGEGRQK